jgi:hypothetical protein
MIPLKAVLEYLILDAYVSNIHTYTYAHYTEH